MNRNHFLMIGLVVLMLGIQVHVVDEYVLTERATQFAAERFGDSKDKAITRSNSLFLASNGPSIPIQKSVEPPEWLGWLLMSVGSVLVLHSFAMSKPS